MYHDLLKQIASEMGRQALQPPCSASELEKLKLDSEHELGFSIPAEYARFLAVTNGLVWNGLTIYANKATPLIGLPDISVEGFVEANRQYRGIRKGDPMHDYLLFGEDSVAFFSYHIPKNAYEVITIVGMTVLECYRTFDELLVDALKGHV